MAFWTFATLVNWFFGLGLGFAAGLALERRGLIGWGAAVVGGTAVVWLLVAAYMDHRMTWFAEIATLYSQVITLHLVLNALVTWLIDRKSGGRSGRERIRPSPDRPARHRPACREVRAPVSSGAVG